METLEPLLLEHQFFQGWSPEHLKIITGCAANVRFGAGEVIFREGQPADRFFILRDGMVAIEILVAHHRSITVETIGKGDVLGWSWAIAPHRWLFSARAVEPTRAISLDAKCLREKCEADYELGYEMFGQMLLVAEKRLRATRLQLLDIYKAEK
jgi:CRP-like cAMP-binding protein